LSIFVFILNAIRSKKSNGQQTDEENGAMHQIIF